MVLGTNPISLGAPANDGDSFVLDMATTATALGKVNMYYILRNTLWPVSYLHCNEFTW